MNKDTYLYISIYLPTYRVSQEIHSGFSVKCDGKTKTNCLANLIYTHNGISLSHSKNNKTMTFASTWIDMEGIMLNKLNQAKTNIICYHLKVKSKESNK